MKVSARASGWHVPPGTLSRPIPRFLYRLCAPLRWCHGSIARIAVLEICSLPRRIATTRKILSPSGGIPIPSDPRQIPHSIAFELACNADMEKLLNQTEFWFRPLDRWLYGQAFLAGAQYLMSNACKADGDKWFPGVQESRQD